MKLLIRNLPRTITEEDIIKMLNTFGEVASCTLVLDKETGKSKGFGFAEMPNEHNALKEIKELNGKMIDNKKIRVKDSEDKA
jgi:RNA recognition motif-containing protein